MRTARFVGPAFSRPALSEEDIPWRRRRRKRKKRSNRPYWVFPAAKHARDPMANRCGERAVFVISKAEKGPVLVPALFCCGCLILARGAGVARASTSGPGATTKDADARLSATRPPWRRRGPGRRGRRRRH